MSLRPVLAALLGLLLLSSNASAEDEPAFLAPLRLPTIDGKGSAATWEFRGTKLLLIEFASW